ncbi:MAG: phosphoglycerate kinase [Parcubacteria group bacterium LiPW_39]|nr:MAG: phosphoglycerate kinase [Parcubacteria group bacterium LiPW_39]
MKLIRDIDVRNKRVLLRVDFNVSLDKQGRVIDDFRIRATLPTIRCLLEQKSKVILLAHLGRPLEESSKFNPPAGGQSSPPAGDLPQGEKFSLRPVAERLSELLGREVRLAPDCVGEEVRSQVAKTSEGEILMLENLRWHPEEETNDAGFAKSLAELGEVYINDAFAVSHRAHASVEAITKFLSSCAGFLLEKEIVNLSRVRDNPEYPLCVIIGGAKISTKIKLIQSFLNQAQDIILGGALANTVLHAKGIAIGKSLIEEAMVPEVKKLEITNTKLHLPVDAVLCTDREGKGICRTGPVGKIGEQELLLDIGPDSEELFAHVIKQAKMTVWNGPIGLFEVEKFSHGTRAVAEAVAESSAFSIVGGGETVAYLEKIGLVDKFSFVSTGGGAMLEFLTGEALPGLEALKRN